MAHTPGPWAIDNDSFHIISTTAFYEPFIEDEEPRPQQVICYFHAMGGEDSRADLALLAAAPTLLDLLQKTREQLRLVQIMRDPDTEYDTTMQLIAEVDAAVQSALNQGK